VQQVTVSDRLYFGRMTPDGLVSDQAWREFLAEVVTPRFPDGLTVWAAEGQWRDASLRITREPALVLEIVHARDAASDAALRSIITAYRQRFRQQAVLWVRDQVTVVD
jgi:hypothetical protein